MAHLLRITDYNGTVEFNAGNNKLLDYVPRSPDLSTVDFTPEALRDGGERLKTTRRNVTESALVVLGGTSTDAMRSAVGSVESYLRQAEEYQERRSGSPVYMEFQPGGSGDVYRSEVLGGKVELSDLTLSASQWNKNKARAVVAYTRRHYWEGSEGTIQLYNSAGTSTTGVAVYNCNDGTPPTGRYNYVEIAGTSVTGDMPTPARLHIVNNDVTYVGLERVYIGHNVYSDPANFIHILEGEGNVTGGTNVAAANTSGGSVGRFTWTSNNETIAYQWTIPPAQLTRAAGQPFQVLSRWKTLTNDVKVRLALETPAALYASTVWQGGQIYLTQWELQQLGALKLSPANLPANYGSTALLTLTVQKTGGAMLDLDYIQLTPIQSFTKLIPNANGMVPQGWCLYDDPANSRTWSTDHPGHTNGIAVHQRLGGPIMLQPGKLQRLYFLADWFAVTHQAPANGTSYLTVDMTYRPRKLTI